MCKCAVSVCIYMHPLCAVPTEARSGALCNWGYWWLCTMWELGTKPGSSATPASAFNHQTSLQPKSQREKLSSGLGDKHTAPHQVLRNSGLCYLENFLNYLHNTVPLMYAGLRVLSKLK